MSVDLTGVFLCCRSVVPHMRERGDGRIVNIASIAGKDGNANAGPYSAAKAGVIALTKSLGKELATSGVLVNCITPAMADTDLLREMTPEYIEGIRAKIPMGRLCRVEEVAEMVAFLSGPGARSPPEACSTSRAAVRCTDFEPDTRSSDPGSDAITLDIMTARMEVLVMRCVHWIPAFAEMTVVRSHSCRARYHSGILGKVEREQANCLNIPEI